MWDHCGMSRNEQGLLEARRMIRELREEFWKELKVPGKTDEVNQELEKAIRMADFLELGELMVLDALNRKESCGAHFREESQTPDGEAQRIDEEYAYVAAWEYDGENEPLLNREPLNFEFVELKQRSYK